jgi:hypothetical protein
VRNAVARFDQVIDVCDTNRALAFDNIEKAAEYYNITSRRRRGAISPLIRSTGHSASA